MKNSFGLGKVIGGILIGTLFGVALRMLFAASNGSKNESIPISGNINAKVIRKKMKKEADALRKKAEELESLADV
jgi:gas vesicle protein